MKYEQPLLPLFDDSLGQPNSLPDQSRWDPLDRQAEHLIDTSVANAYTARYNPATDPRPTYVGRDQQPQVPSRQMSWRPLSADGIEELRENAAAARALFLATRDETRARSQDKR